MFIVHHISKAGLDRLFHAVAKPAIRNGKFDWVAPAWWHALYAFGHLKNPRDRVQP